MRRMKKKEISEEEIPAVSVTREPLELEEGIAYEVILRGLGEYFGGQAKDFATGEYKDERIRNIGLVVEDPEEPGKELIISTSANSLLGRQIADALGVRDEDGILWLKEDLLGRKVWIGWRWAGGEERKYKRLHLRITDEKVETEMSLVGSEQRRKLGERSEEESGEIEVEL